MKKYKKRKSKEKVNIKGEREKGMRKEGHEEGRKTE